MAYIAATVFYQAAIFARNPALSASWIGAMLALFISVILALRWWGLREKRRLFRAMAADAA